MTRWLASLGWLIAGVVMLVVAWRINAGREALIGIFYGASILTANVVSGIVYEGACQVIGRAQLVAIGLAGLSIGWSLLVVRRWAPRLASRFSSRLLHRPYLAIVGLVALMLVGILRARLATVDGRSVFGVDDDAFISLRYANNFAHGLGLVYNAGERVEGYTNFLWVVLMAIPLRLGVPLRTAPAVALVVNFALVAGTATLMHKALRALRCPRWSAFAVGLAFVFDCNTVCFAAGGLETPLLAFLVVASTCLALRGRVGSTFLALGLLPLARSDASVIASVLTVSAVAQFRSRGLSIRSLPVAVVLPVAHLLFRHAYYGEWFPNTYYLKMLALPDRLLLGVGNYAFRTIWLYGVWFLLAIAALSLPRSRLVTAGWLVTSVAQFAYSVFVGGDIFWLVRFIAPVLPLVFMAGARAAGELHVRHRAPAAAVATVAFSAMLLSITPVQTASGGLGQQGPLEDWIKASATTGAWVAANAAPATVTAYPAGAVPFFAANVSFIDVLGKNDHHIAHVPRYESLVIGHNRFDFDYVYDVRKPDVAFVDRWCGDFEAPRYMTEAERAKLREHEPRSSPAWDYDRTNPTFMDLYSRNAIHMVGPPESLLGCLFVREGSSVSQFWSRSGEVPRARALRYRFQAPNEDGRIALAGRWILPPTEDGKPAVGTSRGESSGEGLMDLWIDLTGDVDIDACVVAAAAATSVLVNGARSIEALAAEPAEGCSGAHMRWHIPQAALELRRSATRLLFAAGLTLSWVTAVSALS
jgi:hypothetical protein